MKVTANFISTSALILYPSSVLVVDHVSGAVFLIVLLAGLTTMFKRFSSLPPLTVQEKAFFIVVSLLFLTALITTYFNDTNLDRGDRFINLIMVIPVYVFFKCVDIKEKYLWSGLAIGTVAALIVGIYQVYGPIHQSRATGAVHQILFGDLSLLLGVMSLAGYTWFRQQKERLVLIPFLVFLAGILASVISLTRGSWLALPFLSLIFIWILSRHLSTKKIVTIFGLLSLVVAIIYLTPQTGVQKRVDETVSNIDRYIKSTNVDDPVRSNSTGSRFEMWQAAWLIFKDNPVVGVGWGNYTDKAMELVEQGILNKEIAEFSHPHNQFMSALAKGGLLAFIALILLFIFPAFIFFRSLRDDTNPQVQRFALAGLILVIGFASFSLSESIFERSRSITFFSFYLAVFMSIVLRNRPD